MSRVSTSRWRHAAARGALAALLALTAAVAHAQDAKVSELMRKVDAREMEDGFCATTGWRPGSAESNRAFREGAVAGSTSVDTFKDGALCATARIEEVYFREGRKCLRYLWWACERGLRCAGGATRSCKGADGMWEDVTD